MRIRSGRKKTRGKRGKEKETAERGETRASEDCVTAVRYIRGKRLFAIPAASSCANSGQIVISRNKLNINAA